MANATKLLTDAEAIEYLGLEEDPDAADLALIMRDHVEEWIKVYCDRRFIIETFRERYNGDGSNQLVLRQYPVVRIRRLSLWPTDVIRIKNNRNYTNATISVYSDRLLLALDNTDTELLFSTYTTFQSLVDRINAIGNDWEAALVSPYFANFMSTELIERMGLYVMEKNWAYCQMPYNRGEFDFDIDSERGIIHLFRYYLERQYDLDFPERSLVGFPHGTRNIFITYDAGFATIPEDLKLATKLILKYMIQRTDEESFGARSQNVGGISVTFEDGEFPKQARMILDTKYRKRKF